MLVVVVPAIHKSVSGRGIMADPSRFVCLKTIVLSLCRFVVVPFLVCRLVALSFTIHRSFSPAKRLSPLCRPKLSAGQVRSARHSSSSLPSNPAMGANPQLRGVSVRCVSSFATPDPEL